MLSSNVVCNSVITQCCSLQAQHNNQILSGDRVSAYLSMGEIFYGNSQLYVAMLQEAYKCCVSAGLVPTDALQTHQSWLSFYSVALSGLMYVYLRDEDSFVLCTSSIGVLNNLANKGLICDKEMKPDRTLACAKDNLCFTSRKALQEGYETNTVATVMLVPTSTDGVHFKYGVRRVNFNADNCVFVPHACATVCNNFIRHTAKNHLLEVTVGTKRRVVTESPQLLEKFYPPERVRELTSIMGVGDVLCKDILSLPVVGASIDSLGTTSIHISRIDTIKIASLADVDTTTISLDLFAIKMYVSDVIARASFEDVYKLGKRLGLEMNANASLGVLRETVITYISSISNTEVYEAFMGFTSMFSVYAYKEYATRYGTKRTEVTITNLEQLKQFLSKYVCQLTLQSNKGGMYRCLVTNNTQILRKLYGRQYIRKYGNAAERLCLLDEKLNWIVNTAGNTSLLGSDAAQVLKEFGFRTERIASTDIYGEVYTTTDILDMARKQVENGSAEERISLLKADLNWIIDTTGNKSLSGSDVAKALKAYGFRTEHIASGEVYTVTDIISMARKQAENEVTVKRPKNPDIISAQRLNMLYGQDDVFRTFNRTQVKKCVIFE